MPDLELDRVGAGTLLTLMDLVAAGLIEAPADDDGEMRLTEAGRALHSEGGFDPLVDRLIEQHIPDDG